MTASPTPSPSSASARTNQPPAASPTTRLSAWYAARAPRERHLLVLAAVLVLGGGLTALAEQLAAERDRLARNLPAARLAYLLMEQDSLSLTALHQRTSAAMPPIGAQPNSIRAAALARAIEAEARIVGDRVEVSGSAAPPALVDWLATLHAEQRLRLVRLELHPAAADGRGRFEAAFEGGGT